MFPLFRLRVSVVGCNALKYSVFAADTPVAGVSVGWGVYPPLLGKFCGGVGDY